MEGDASCPSEEAHVSPCFSGATTLPGASSHLDCFCNKPGTVGVMQANGYLRCETLSAGVVLVNSVKQCQPLWTVRFLQLTQKATRVCPCFTLRIVG